MVLGVNGIRLVGKRSGVGRVIEAVLTCMGELEHPFSEIRVYSPQPIDDSIKLPPIAHNIVIPSLLPPGLWEQFVLLRAHGSKDVLFCPSYVMPLLARCPSLLVHHGSYEGYEDAVQVYGRWTMAKAKTMYQLSARRADIVSTVSQYSKQDMVHYYGLDPDRIHVIPDGVDTDLFKPIEDQSLLADWRRRVIGEDIPFILYVGKPTRRRNLPNLLAAFAQIKHRNGFTHKLLLIGTSLPGTSFTAHIRELGLDKEVVEIGYAKHEEIVKAYNASEVMVYPSSYEGFGMPVLEAMACGTPVIALNNTAFPEFAGGVASLLPDAEVDTLANGITEVLLDQALRERMSLAGPQRAAAYDWHIVSQSYIDLLTELAPEKHSVASART